MSHARNPAKQSGGSGRETPTARSKPAPAPASSNFEHIVFQLASGAQGEGRQESDANTAAAGAVAQSAPYGIIIEDGLPAGDGQVNRTEFMDRLAPMIESAAEEILAPAGRVARDCPYLSFWLTYYRGQSAIHIERAIAHYVRPARRDRAGIEEAILNQVRQAVQAWVDRREVHVPDPVDWRIADDKISSPAGPPGPAAQKMGEDGAGAPGQPGSAAAIRSRLSKGRPLEPSVRSRMERGFGVDFDQVRLHDDAHAAYVARDYRARAFTVGQDIGFNAGQYQPGTARRRSAACT